MLKSWIEVSEERLAENYRTIVEAAGTQTDVLAVVKANAYGHGADVCGAALARAGARWLGVADAGEGVALRAALDGAGLSEARAPRILVMCGLMAEDVPAIVGSRLTPVVWTEQQVRWLAGSGVRVHLEMETGMGRQGMKPGADLQRLLDAMDAAGVALDGVMTHFSAAEVADGEVTRAQQQRFEECIAQVRERGLRPSWIHAGSSSTMDNPPEGGEWLVELAKTVGARAMVRCGIALYGYCLPIAGAAQCEPRLRRKLRPVMTWKTRILDVRDFAPGETVGYNARYRVNAPMRLALLPVGYSDGLRRELSSTNEQGGGWVMIAGADKVLRRAVIVGRISMNLTMVDVTEIAGVKVGDEVVLLGEGVTADDHARLAETISYEILCGVRAG